MKEYIFPGDFKEGWSISQLFMVWLKYPVILFFPLISDYKNMDIEVTKSDQLKKKSIKYFKKFQ